MDRMPPPSTYRVCFVCSGNICRSPMAESIFGVLAARAGLDVWAGSAGIGDWHSGEPADPRARRALSAHGYPEGDHRARQFDPARFADLDLIVALDAGHRRILQSWASDDETRSRIRLLRSFDPVLGASISGPAGDIADPYYDGDQAFSDALDQIELACTGLVEAIRTGQAPRLSPAGPSRLR